MSTWSAPGREWQPAVRVGLGCASLGNLFTAITDAAAEQTVEAAWQAGVRYFDTAPHYGLGLSERRLGAALRGRPRDQYLISTKVGRLLVPDPSGAGRRDSEGFAVPADHRRVWDFSRDGVRRSLDGSLRRLGLDRADLVLIHDPDDHLDEALSVAYPALVALRDSGAVTAIGVGSKRVDVLRRFVAETDLDVILLAGRYTLLEQPAAADLLPACQRRGVAVVNAGVFNSGLLATDDPAAGASYEYAPAPAAVLDRARGIAAVCARHRVPLPTAALAFAAAHPAVTGVLVGAASADQVRRNAAALAAPAPPPQLWRDLVAAGLLDAAAALPGPA
jgi:D-threo-aldose 1-dehydrogenase